MSEGIPTSEDKTPEEIELERERKMLAEQREANREKLRKLLARIEAEHAPKPRVKITGEMRKGARRNRYTDGNVE